jgi:hypothetical protein
MSAPARSGMPEQSYVERRPMPALGELVSSVWIQRIAPDTAPYSLCNLPHGGVELVCRLGSVPRVAGPLTGPVVEVLPPGTTDFQSRMPASMRVSSGWPCRRPSAPP